jgi:GT2 family glycosyltransferase
MKKIVNVVICYDNMSEIIEYAFSLSVQKGFEELSLVVVVNKLTNTTISELKHNLSDLPYEVLVVTKNENLGYMNGLIFGYQQYRKHCDTIPDYVIMSNTDIKYPNDNFLIELSDREYDKDIWCIGPSVYSPNKDSYDNPVSYERRLKSQIERLIWIFSIPILNVTYITLSDIKASIKKPHKQNSSMVYQVHGCFFVITGEYAEFMKDKVYGALLYSEEAFVSELVYQNRKKIYYDSNLEVQHIEHTVTGKINKKKIAKYLADSMSVIKRDFYNKVNVDG